MSADEKVRIVSEEQNENLLLPITIKEVKAVVFAMHPDKSPGLDGLNPVFFQTYWTIMRADVVRFCKNFFSNGAIPEGLNCSLVCLIPKVKNPQQMTELRPISLCNVLMRILSKVMTNKMKPYLQSIISDR